EKEGLVRAVVQARDSDRAAERSAKIILSQSAFRLSQLIVKPVVGVEEVVAQIIEKRSVKLVRAGARKKRELPPRRAPVFGGICGALHSKFLERIHRNQALSRTQDGSCW